MENLSSKIARGAGWMVALRMSVRGLGLISTIILARLLVPDDFGLVALATAIYAIAEILGAFNFDSALIHKQKTSREYYDTAWTLNLIYGVFAGLLLALLAAPAAVFFEEPRLEPIIYVLAATAFIARTENIGVFEFRRELRMHKVFGLQISRKIVAFAVTVTLAVIYVSYWAMIAGIVAGTLTRVAMTYWVHPFRPRPALSKTNELFGFSKWVLVTNIFGFGNNRADDLIVGKILGPATLGLYTVAYEISNLTASELVKPINQTLFPGYAKANQSPGLLVHYYLKTVSVLALVSLPVGVGLALVAGSLVSVVLGEKWIEAIPLLQVLAVYGAVRAITAANGSVYLAIGRPKIPALFTGLKVLILIPSLIFAVSQYGAIGAAVAQLLVTLTIVPITIYVLIRHVDLRMRDVGRVLWRPILSVLVMAICVITVQYYIGQTNSVSQLLLSIAAGASSYLGSVLFMWRMTGSPDGGEQYIVSRMKESFNRISFN